LTHTPLFPVQSPCLAPIQSFTLLAAHTSLKEVRTAVILE